MFRLPHLFSFISRLFHLLPLLHLLLSLFFLLPVLVVSLECWLLVYQTNQPFYLFVWRRSRLLLFDSVLPVCLPAPVLFFLLLHHPLTSILFVYPFVAGILLLNDSEGLFFSLVYPSVLWTVSLKQIIVLQKERPPFQLFIFTSSPSANILVFFPSSLFCCVSLRIFLFL